MTCDRISERNESNRVLESLDERREFQSSGILGWAASNTASDDGREEADVGGRLLLLGAAGAAELLGVFLEVEHPGVIVDLEAVVEALAGRGRRLLRGRHRRGVHGVHELYHRRG